MALDFAYPNKPADQRGWGPGYPNCQEEKWIPLEAKNGTGFGRVHRRVHRLLQLLIDKSIDLNYPPKDGQCWGSVCRCSHRPDGTCAEDSNGNPIPSNHSWGLAIDFNSIENPFGGSSHEMPARIVKLFHSYGFRWLGDTEIHDWMHFDFCGTPKDADRMTAKAEANLVSKGYKFAGKTYKTKILALRALSKSLGDAKVGATRSIKVVQK